MVGLDKGWIGNGCSRLQFFLKVVVSCLGLEAMGLLGYVVIGEHGLTQFFMGVEGFLMIEVSGEKLWGYGVAVVLGSLVASYEFQSGVFC